MYVEMKHNTTCFSTFSRILKHFLRSLGLNKPNENNTIKSAKSKTEKINTMLSYLIGIIQLTYLKNYFNV